MDAGGVSALFDALPVSDDAKAELAQRMGEASRFYHSRAHIELLWTRHCAFAAGTGLRESPLEAMIALAIAYHDAVYVAGARDNELLSAQLWLHVGAQEAGCAEINRLWVADTILATADHVGAAKTLDLSDPRDFARQWVLDLDLTPLGEAPDVFDANMRLLAAENPQLPPAEQEKTSLAALRHFATARPLYKCPGLRAAFEVTARGNLRRILGAEAD